MAITVAPSTRYALTLAPNFVADTLAEVQAVMASHEGSYYMVNGIIYLVVRDRGEFKLHKVAHDSFAYDHFDETSAASTKEPSGFENQNDSQISFVDSTKTFTISPTGVSYKVWIDGISYTFSTPLSLVITNAQGLHYFYFDKATKTLATTMDLATFVDNVPCAILYWSTVEQRAIYFANERHGIQMDDATRLYLHETFGTQWVNGLSLYNFTIGDGSLAVHRKFGAQNGVIKDEDIRINIFDSSPQDINPYLFAPVFYKEGIAANWRKKNADENSFIIIGDNGYPGIRPAYNSFIASSWGLTEVANNKYFLIHVVGTNDIRHPIIIILGENQYASAAEAKQGSLTELKNVAGLPFSEFSPLGTVIYQASDRYPAPQHAAIVAADSGVYVDWRGKYAYGTVTGAVAQEPAFGVIVTDSGNSIAVTPSDTVELRGGTNINTSAEGKVVTIDSTFDTKEFLLSEKSQTILAATHGFTRISSIEQFIGSVPISLSVTLVGLDIVIESNIDMTGVTLSVSGYK